MQAWARSDTTVFLTQQEFTMLWKNAFLYYPVKKVYVAIWIGSRHKDLYNGMTLAQSLHKMCQSIRKDVNN